jgi:hypothetical protein
MMCGCACPTYSQKVPYAIPKRKAARTGADNQLRSQRLALPRAQRRPLQSPTGAEVGAKVFIMRTLNPHIKPVPSWGQTSDALAVPRTLERARVVATREVDDAER